MQPRCKKCGRPLSDPESIARGMGPECAGISGNCGKSVRVRRQNESGSSYDVPAKNHSAMPLFAWSGDKDSQKHVPTQLAGFPSHLLNLVLSAPATGAIAMHVKDHGRKRSKNKGRSPIVTLREIRRACINLRMLLAGLFIQGRTAGMYPLRRRQLENW